MIDKREHARKLLATEANITDESEEIWHPIRLFDISKTGVAFLTPNDIALNTLHNFEICLPDSTKKIVFVAIVLHSSALASTGGFRIGAKFIGIDEEDVALIKDYVGNATGG